MPRNIEVSERYDALISIMVGICLGLILFIGLLLINTHRLKTDSDHIRVIIENTTQDII